MCVRMSISTSLLSALLSALRVATCLSYSRGLKARTLSIRRQRGKNRDDMARKQRIEVLDRHHRYPREFNFVGTLRADHFINCCHRLVTGVREPA